MTMTKSNARQNQTKHLPGWEICTTRTAVPWWEPKPYDSELFE